MAVIKSSIERSKNMAKIRSHDTEPEDYIRKRLFSLGYRYWRNVNTVAGHPDIWLEKHHTVILANGCCGIGIRAISGSCPVWSELIRRNYLCDHSHKSLNVQSNPLRRQGVTSFSAIPFPVPRLPQPCSHCLRRQRRMVRTLTST